MHVRLWSIHNEHFWEQARARGRFDLDSRHPAAFGHDCQAAYDWMRAQVARRVAAPSRGWPLWAWAERPDMRAYAHTPPPGQRLVMLELLVPREKVLFSDYTDWHQVLNDAYHASADEEADETFWESDAYERKQQDPATKVASWQRIFDLEPGDTIQACVDDPQLAWVIGARYFKGRPKR